MSFAEQLVSEKDRLGKIGIDEDIAFLPFPGEDHVEHATRLRIRAALFDVLVWRHIRTMTAEQILAHAEK